jgi:polar amino acid transport system substrate-binding protein
MRILKGIIALALVAAFAAACTGGSSPTPVPTAAPTPVPSTTPTAAPTEAPTATPDACAPANLALKAAGALTVGADNPAYPPYFAHREGGNTPPWEDSDYTGDPTTGEGFESAVAYAIADKLGIAKDKVTWIVVPFTNSFAPGAKDFDFYITQVSYKPERAEAADLSEGYYTVLQSVVALKDSPLAGAKTIADLAGYSYGAQTGTTSYDTIVNTIKPTKEPQVFDTNDLAVEALKSGQIDGLVVDLPTADFVTNVQVENAVAVGKFDTGTAEYFSVVMEKGSALTACVNAAIKALNDDGTLAGLVTSQLPFQDSVPAFQP